MEPLREMSEFWADVEDHNEKILKRVRSSGDLKLDEASWKKPTAEYDSGSLHGPYFSVDEVKRVVRSKVRLLPRIPVWEQHGGAAEPTCRNIDNGLSGEPNNFCGSLFTNRPADLDLFIGMLRYVLSLFLLANLMGFTSEFKSAYR